MRLRLNGEERELRDECTVAELVEELGLRPEIVAVERNRELVRRREYDRVRLADGDAVEIVTLVGGG